MTVQVPGLQLHNIGLRDLPITNYFVGTLFEIHNGYYFKYCYTSRLNTYFKSQYLKHEFNNCDINIYLVILTGQ